MTLQEQYNSIKGGKGNKAQFLKQARLLFPEYFNQYSDFDTATNVLKSKQIISEVAGGVVSKGYSTYDWKKILGEEVKATEKETSKEAADANRNAFQPSDMKNADNVNFNEIMKGFFAEMYDEKNKGKTGDEIKAMVVKNLAKDTLYYTKNGNFSTMGVGYTDEAPGLGKNTQPTSKVASVLGGSDEVDSKSDVVKNSLVGTTKKVKLKESVTGENPYFDTDPSDGDADHEKSMQYGAENFYDKGLEAFKNGDLEKAQEYYEQAREFGSWLGWREQELPPYDTLQEEQKLRSLIRNLIKEELNSSTKYEITASNVNEESLNNILDAIELVNSNGLDLKTIDNTGHYAGRYNHINSVYVNSSIPFSTLIRKFNDILKNNNIYNIHIQEELNEYGEANLNENESSVQKGDILYHKNSDSTLEVVEVSPTNIKMKVTKISDKTPSYIKVGQSSKTNPSAIGKTYTKK